MYEPNNAKSSHFYRIFALAMGVAFASHAYAAPAPISIRDVAAKNLTGLALEEAEQGSWNTLRKQAREFLEFRRGRLDSRRRLAWISECFARPGENAFCEFMQSKNGRELKRLDLPQPEPLVIPHWDEADIDRTVAQLKKADFAKLRTVPEQRVLRALKQFNSWSDLEFIARKSQEASTCPGTGILTALGLKTEEFFPDPRYRNMSRAFYTRASECGGDDDSAFKARYRLSLMNIWEGECSNALPLLQRLSEQKNGDYVSRALFWAAHCSAVTGSGEKRQVASQRLITEFPLSYHGLLISSPRDLRAREILGKRETAALFRSIRHPELNSLVRSIEALQSLGPDQEALDVSRDMLEALADRLADTELGFRLYVACLMTRVRMGNGVFKTLAGIFRDDPTAITRSSLELFYPLYRFDDLKKQGWRVDPYLVAALIRQESGFNEQARSAAGALGLMQLMPETARRFEHVTRRELLDAKTNIRLGVKYFDQLLVRYKYDAELALAAYNAGPEKVDDWLKRYPIANRMLFFDLIPFRETRDYVALIVRNYYWYRSLYGLGAVLGAQTATVNRMVASGSISGVGVQPKKALLFTLFGR